jgi:DNA polymerase III psi subunit
MLSNRQKAYLDAMDIGVWSLREPVALKDAVVEPFTHLKLGPGSGGILVICATDTDSAGRLANDIKRVLGSSPVWAWPFNGRGAVDLTRAIDDKLFTTVAIFGQQLATQLFDGELPARLHSANLVLLPSMLDIRDRAEARRALWLTFCRSGMLESG